MLDSNFKSTWSRAIIVCDKWRTGKDAGTLAKRTMRGSARRGGHSTGKDAGTLAKRTMCGSTAKRTMRGSAQRGGHSAAQGGVPF